MPSPADEAPSMGPTSANDLQSMSSTSAERLGPKGSTSNNRLTQLNLGGLLEFQKPVASKRARTPDSATSSSTVLSSKRVAFTSPPGHGAIQPGLKDLKIVTAIKNGVSVLDSKPVRLEPPWKYFREVYELNLGAFFSIVSDRELPHDIFMIKRLRGPDAAKKTRMLRGVRHKKFLDMLECFSFEGTFYPIFPHVPISLAHIAKSPPYPTEFELAAALGQIVEGLAYLASRGLEHGHLSCSNILISTEGDIKIAGQECCEKLASPDRSSLRDMRALSNVTMELMQKYIKDDGRIGIDDDERWPSDCKGVDFLAMTTSATSMDELVQHPLLQIGWEKRDLKWMVSLAAVSTHRGFKYRE